MVRIGFGAGAWAPVGTAPEAHTHANAYRTATRPGKLVFAVNEFISILL